MFADGWDAERERRLARQKELGIVPTGTRLPPRNDAVRPWSEAPDGEQRLFTRLQAAYAAMLDHADQHLARLVGFLETAGLRDDTLILVMTDNGASQEGGPLGMVNAMGPYNCAASRSRRRSRASTISAGRTPTPTFRWAGRWPPTRR